MAATKSKTKDENTEQADVVNGRGVYSTRRVSDDPATYQSLSGKWTVTRAKSPEDPKLPWTLQRKAANGKLVDEGTFRTSDLALLEAAKTDKAVKADAVISY